MTNSPPKQEYPSPSIVVGMGRFGLAVLERLGEDWAGLQQATEDASLKNLRLLHVRPRDGVEEGAWRKNERQLVEIARYTGDGDLPTLALDFVILRSLGLIRYRNGTYQVAVPRDDGVVEVPSGRAEPDFARMRYFHWLNLSPDPVSSVERLRALCEREAELDLFITPLVNRARQGHSPRTILACISRCRALAEGRDPWPWGWLFRPLVEREPADDADADADADRGRTHRIDFERDWLSPTDTSGLLEGLCAEPIAGWKPWLRNARLGPTEPDVDSIELPEDAFDLCLPEPFLPRAGDLSAPIAPFELLKVDWEATGWATREIGASTSVEFSPVKSSAFRLGLFDHDGSSRVHQTHAADFEKRLRELAIHAHRGLVRMWVDLQRERVESRDDEFDQGRRRDSVDGALDQSLEVLGELLVRPLVSQHDAGPRAEGSPDDFAEEPTSLPSRDDHLELDERASSALRELVVAEPPPENAAREALDTRLSSLGFDPPPRDASARHLFSEVELGPGDVGADDEQPSVADPDVLNQRSDGLLEFRELLNAHTRELFDFSFLKQYRNRPLKRAPRLTIYVVCDATEAFARASVRTVLREVHAELLRAFGPIFEAFREGFDRALSVVPIIWMPHPADSFGGRHPLANRLEEAAIIESIQGVRRWVESVPRKKRCIPQVFINSRVTDNAVLSVCDSVRQTRDFLSFQVRNDLSADPWLRRTAIGTRGDDFFASFSCHEIEFPAERAREYLANRYARHSIRRLEDGERGALPEVSGDEIAAPAVDELVAEPTARLADECERAAQRTAQKVRGRLAIAPSTTVDEVEDHFDASFEEQLLEAIHRQWQNFTRRRGEMDDMVDALRRATSDELDETLDSVHKAGDRLIEEHASKGGLKRALAGFGELHAAARDRLRDREADRKQKESLCLQHSIPRTASVGSAREQVVREGRDKPDGKAMHAGLLVWALMAPALGAPLAWAVAKALELHLAPNAVEFILGPLGPLVGALVVFLPAFFLLRRHMRAHIERLEEAIDQMAEAVGRVVDGGSAALSSAPSIRSFMQARLVHTAGLATRGFARQVYARVLRDLELAGRLRRSIDLQRDVLERQAEDLGVRVKMSDLEADSGEDDLSWLFSSSAGAPLDKLIDPAQLLDYYARRIGGDHEVDGMLERFIEEVEGFANWRKVASLSDTDRILRFARTEFDELVEHPVSDQFIFEAQVRERLMDFVLTHYPNIGFGAKFAGYEGLDPDGVDLMAETALVLHPGLAAVFEEAKKALEGPSRLEALRIKEAEIEPNAAFMLSLVQGIRPHSVRNLRRFESFHHRAQMPDDRAFPLSGDAERQHAGSPINHLTGYDSLRQSINRGVFQFVSEFDGKRADEASEDGGSDE